MNYSNYRLSLDIHDIRSNVVIKVKRGTNTKRLCITLTENGKVYEIGNSCTAEFKGKRPDGKSLSLPVEKIERNVIYYVIGTSTTKVAGIVEGEIRITSGDGKVIASPTFSILVEGNIVDDDNVINPDEDPSTGGTGVGIGDNGVIVNTPTYAFAVTDKDGKVAIAVDKNGNVFDSRGNGLGTKNVSNYAFAVTDKDGRVALGVKVDENGEPVFDFVGKDKLSAAKPLKQNGNYDAEINMFICYGQSWSTGYDVRAITTTPRYDNLMLDTGIMNNPLNDLSVTATSFVPAVERTGKSSPTGQTVGETPVTAQMNVVKQLMESEDGLTVNDLSYQLLGTAPGMGSKSLAQLSKGTDYYTRLIAQVQQAHDIATAMGKRLVVQAFSWVQGAIGSGLTGTYAENLEKLRLDIDADVKAITGQTQDVKCITWQSFMINPSVTAKSVYNDYVGASETYPNIICAGATYQLDNIRDANLHLTAEHNDLMGALFGVAYKRTIIDGEKFEPLKPISANHTGKILYVKFNVPQRPLVLDTESFGEVTNKGFHLYAADNTKKTIVDVAVISPDTVKIVCYDDVLSTDRLVYVPNLIKEIYAGDTQIKFHWVSDCRGNLRDSQGDYIQYVTDAYKTASGTAVPSKVFPLHNWCVIFDKTIEELED